MRYFKLFTPVAVLLVLGGSSPVSAQIFNDPNGSHVIEELNGGNRLTLSGNLGTLTVGLVDGNSVLDASALRVNKIVFTDRIDGQSVVLLNAVWTTDRAGRKVPPTVEFQRRIDGQSTVLLTAPDASVRFLEKVDGQSMVSVSAPGGTVDFATAPSGLLDEGSKIDGRSIVEITARRVFLRAKVDGGPVTRVFVTLTARGSLQPTEVNGGSKIFFRKANPSDPEPSVGTPHIDGRGSLFQRLP